MYKTVSYWSAPEPEDVAAFEEYYEQVHSLMAARVPGVVKFESTITSDGIGGFPPAFYRVAETYFTDKAAMNAAAQTPEWAELIEDAGYIIDRFGVALESAAGECTEATLNSRARRPDAQQTLRTAHTSGNAS
jgi:uncharacterized protein (TIGR02118 family)